MEIFKKLAFCILVSALFTACGGGGGDTSTSTETGVNTESTNWDNAQWDKSTWK